MSGQIMEGLKWPELENYKRFFSRMTLESGFQKIDLAQTVSDRKWIKTYVERLITRVLQWFRSGATTQAATVRVTETMRKKRGNLYVKNITKVRYTRVLITGWMPRMD